MKKLTDKQELFCTTYVETRNAAEAYRCAYDSDNMKESTIIRNAHEVIHTEHVRARVDLLLAEHRTRHDVTVDSLAFDLSRSYNLAMEKGQCGAAVQAIMGQARLFGFGVDKKDVRLIDDRSLEEAKELLKSVGLNPDG